MGEAAPFWAAGIQSLEYKSEFSRDVIEIKNSRTLVDWLRCRQHCRPGVKHSCTIYPFREILSPFYRDECTWRPPFILQGLLQMFVFASYHCVTEVVLGPRVLSVAAFRLVTKCSKGKRNTGYPLWSDHLWSLFSTKAREELPGTGKIPKFASCSGVCWWKSGAEH